MPTEDDKKIAKPVAETPAAAAAQLFDDGLPPWLAGVSEFVKKYQNVLYAVATVVLLTWAILKFQAANKDKQMNSAEWELKQAESVEALRGVLDKYKGLAIEPRIRLRIGAKLVDDGKMDEAIKEFETVKSKWPESLAGKLAASQLSTAQENKAWDGKGGKLEQELDTLRALTADETAPVGPTPVAVKIDDSLPPQVELTTSAGQVVIELDEDAAPNATAAFVRNVETQFYDKTAVYKVEKDVAVFMGDILPTGDSPRTWSIPFETSKLPLVGGTVALVRDLPPEGQPDTDALKNTGAFHFVIFTGEAPQYKDRFLVIGRVTKGIEAVRKLASTDTIKAAKMLQKKSHPYAPKELPKEPPKPEEPPKEPPK